MVSSAPTIGRMPCVRAAAWKRGVLYNPSRSVTAMACNPRFAACAARVSGIEAPRRKLNALLECSSMYDIGGSRGVP